MSLPQDHNANNNNNNIIISSNNDNDISIISSNKNSNNKPPMCFLSNKPCRNGTESTFKIAALPYSTGEQQSNPIQRFSLYTRSHYYNSLSFFPASSFGYQREGGVGDRPGVCVLVVLACCCCCCCLFVCVCVQNKWKKKQTSNLQ
mmetsp:Transcript_17030/g.28920  ORF Transcript_17030/g.28920 Transcript_17030/m.28920 type:complete len:146 (-) Transcript_17030:196-633(-)